MYSSRLLGFYVNRALFVQPIFFVKTANADAGLENSGNCFGKGSIDDACGGVTPPNSANMTRLLGFFFTSPSIMELGWLPWEGRRSRKKGSSLKRFICPMERRIKSNKSSKKGWVVAFPVCWFEALNKMNYTLSGRGFYQTNLQSNRSAWN